MKKALPWIIGILALLVLFACIQVGWLYSILTIGIVCGVIYAIHLLHKKAWQPGASGRIINIAKVSKTIVIVISACLIFAGVVLGGIGLLNPETDGYYSQVCGYCGGSGRLTSGKICGLCDGWGGAISENLVFDNHTWIGILMAASGAVMLIGAMSYTTSTMQSSSVTDLSAVRIDTPAVSFAVSYGHYVNDNISNAWKPEQANISGAWTIRSFVKYLHEKPARKLVLYVAPYNNYGNRIKAEEILLFEGDFNVGYTNTIVWKKLWTGAQLSRIEIIKTKVYFKDGTIEEIYHQ